MRTIPDDRWIAVPAVPTTNSKIREIIYIWAPSVKAVKGNDIMGQCTIYAEGIPPLEVNFSLDEVIDLIRESYDAFVENEVE